MYSVCIYTLLKVVGYYGCSVRDGFPKKSLDGVGGLGELYPSFFFDFLIFFNFAKPLNELDS